MNAFTCKERGHEVASTGDLVAAMTRAATNLNGSSLTLPPYSLHSSNRTHLEKCLMNLTQLANKYGSDKGTLEQVGGHRYTYLYDLLFGPLRDSPISLLELGLARGGPEVGGPIERSIMSPSVSMWLEYFPSASIVGFDISDFSQMAGERFTFVRGDQGIEDDIRALTRVKQEYDVIIDDLSHASYHQQLAFKVLFPALAAGGLYLIEDLHWQPEFELGLAKVPKTGHFFSKFFEDLEDLSNPVLSEDFMRSVAQVTEVASFFPAFAGHPFPIKLIVLRKQGSLAQSSLSKSKSSWVAVKESFRPKAGLGGAGTEMRYNTELAKQVTQAATDMPYHTISFAKLLEEVDGSGPTGSLPLVPGEPSLTDFSALFVGALRIDPAAPCLLRFARDVMAGWHQRRQLDELVSMTNYLLKSISLTPPQLGSAWADEAVRTCHGLHVEANRLIYDLVETDPKHGCVRLELEEVVAAIRSKLAGKKVLFLFVTSEYLRNFELWAQVWAQHETGAELAVLGIGAETCVQIRRTIETHNLRRASVFKYTPSLPLSVCGNGSNLRFLWFLKIYITAALVSSQCTVVYSDLDSFWMHDFLNLCEKVSSDIQADLLLMNATDMPRFGVLAWGFVPCAGLFFVRPTLAGLAFMLEWLHYTEVMFDDQIGLTQLLYDAQVKWGRATPSELELIAEVKLPGDGKAIIGVFSPAVAKRDGSGDVRGAVGTCVWHPRWIVNPEAFESFAPELIAIATRQRRLETFGSMFSAS